MKIFRILIISLIIISIIILPAFAERLFVIIPFENNSENTETNYIGKSFTDIQSVSLRGVLDFDYYIPDRNYLNTLLRSKNLTIKDLKNESSIINFSKYIKSNKTLFGSFSYNNGNYEVKANLIDNSGKKIWEKKLSGNNIFQIQNQLTLEILKLNNIPISSLVRNRINAISNSEFNENILKNYVYSNNFLYSGKIFDSINELNSNTDNLLILSKLAKHQALLSLYTNDKNLIEKSKKNAEFVINKNNNYSDSYKSLSIYEYMNKNYAKAKDYAKGAIEINIKDEEAYLLLWLSRENKLTDDFEFKRTLELNPYFDIAYYQKGIFLSEKGNKSESIESFKKSIELNPNNSYALLKISGIETTKNNNQQNNIKENVNNKEETPKEKKEDLTQNTTNKEEKVKTKQDIAYLQKAYEIDNKNFNVNLELGKYYHEKNDNNKALTHFKNALEVQPQNEEVNFQIAKIYHLYNKLDKSIEYYKKLIQINPNNAKYYSGIGQIYYQIGDYYKAGGNLEIAVQKDPKLAFAYVNLGNVLNKKGKPQEALEKYKKALSITPNYEYAYFNMAEFYKEQNDFENALDYYHRILVLKPRDIQVINKIGDVFRKKGDYKRAIEEFTKAIKISPEYVESYHNIGLVHLEQNKLDEALSSLKTAIRLNSNFKPVYSSLSKTYALIGFKYHTEKKYNDAIKAYLEAIKYKPDESDPYNNLGTVYYSIGKYDNAVEYYKKAILLNYKNANAHDNLGMAYHKAGLLKEAVEEYRKACKYGKRNTCDWLLKNNLRLE